MSNPGDFFEFLCVMFALKSAVTSYASLELSKF